MRRKEFEIEERTLIEDVLRAAEVGYLAFNGPEGWPRLTPLSFLFDGRILWHGAVAGERLACLQADSRATFSAVSVQRYLPSYFTSAENANRATVVFKSVQVSGRCSSIDEPEEKCAVLNGLLEKYQPEGRYKRVSPQDPLYEKILPGTGVFALTVEKASGKFKFCQNMPETDRRNIAARLQEKGAPADLRIAEEILKTL